jgi:hypothetical protein
MPAMSTMRAAGEWGTNAVASMFYLVHPANLALDHTDPHPQYMLKYGIPMFFLMIGAEQFCLYGRRLLRKSEDTERTVDKYRFNDAIACIMLGSFQQMTSLLLELVGIEFEMGAYQLVFNNFRMFDIAVKQNVSLSFHCFHFSVFTFVGCRFTSLTLFCCWALTWATMLRIA